MVSIELTCSEAYGSAASFLKNDVFFSVFFLLAVAALVESRWCGGVVVWW